MVRFFLTIHGEEHTLEVDFQNELTCALDGVEFQAEVAEVRPDVYSVLIGGKSFAVRVDSASGGEYAIHVDGVCYMVSARDPRRRQNDRTRLAVEGRQTVKAPMPGKVVRVLAAEGQAVDAGQGLAVIEAMKMQNEIKSPKAGRVRNVLVGEGQAVNAGETLLIVE